MYSDGVKHEKACAPYETVLCFGTVSRDLDDECRVLEGMCGISKADMYEGARPCSPLYVRTRTLKSMRWQIGSQCDSIKIGVMWSNFFVFMISRAVTFWAD